MEDKMIVKHYILKSTTKPYPSISKINRLYNIHEQIDWKDETHRFYTSMYTNSCSSIASFLVRVYAT